MKCEHSSFPLLDNFCKEIDPWNKSNFSDFRNLLYKYLQIAENTILVHVDITSLYTNVLSTQNLDRIQNILQESKIFPSIAPENVVRTVWRQFENII